MNKLYSQWCRVAGLVAGLLLNAGVYAADVQIEGAWAFATAPGKDTANVYMYITSKQSVLLVGASSPKSKAVELRTMLHKGGMMKTITVPNVELSANTRADMTSEHGYHVTLVGLKSALKAGKSVPLTLNFESANKQLVTVDVKAEIRPARGSK